MKSLKVLTVGIVLAALLTVGCEGAKKDPDLEQPAEPTEETTATEVKESAAEVTTPVEEDEYKGKLLTPSPGKSIIYILRPAMLGLAVPFKVLVDGENIGFTMGGSYLYKEVDPGKHEIVSVSENRASILITTEPDQLSFVKQEVSMGFMVARNSLVEIGPVEGKRALKNCTLSK